MQSNEVVKQAIGKKTKEIAKELKVSLETVYKWKDSSLRDPLERVIALYKKTGDINLIKYICQESGGYFVKAFDDHECTDAKIIPAAVKEFGDLMTELGLSLADGVITDDELYRLKKEFGDLVSLMTAFFEACEKGKFS
tara:strand:+ start:224 stop:640 length:417 start_codon:yes stop_codon:yes gene_type:complete